MKRFGKAKQTWDQWRIEHAPHLGVDAALENEQALVDGYQVMMERDFGMAERAKSGATDSRKRSSPISSPATGAALSGSEECVDSPVVSKKARLGSDQGVRGDVFFVKETQFGTLLPLDAKQRSPEKKKGKKDKLLRRSSSLESDFEQLSPSFITTSTTPAPTLPRTKSLPGASLERIPETFEESEDMLRSTAIPPTPIAATDAGVRKSVVSALSPCCLTVDNGMTAHPPSSTLVAQSPSTSSPAPATPQEGPRPRQSASSSTTPPAQPKEKTTSPKSPPGNTGQGAEVRRSFSFHNFVLVDSTTLLFEDKRARTQAGEVRSCGEKEVRKGEAHRSRVRAV